METLEALQGDEFGGSCEFLGCWGVLRDKSWGEKVSLGIFGGFRVVSCLLVAPKSPKVGHGVDLETLQALQGDELGGVSFLGCCGVLRGKSWVEKGSCGFGRGSPWSPAFWWPPKTPKVGHGVDLETLEALQGDELGGVSVFWGAESLERQNLG